MNFLSASFYWVFSLILGKRGEQSAEGFLE